MIISGLRRFVIPLATGVALLAGTAAAQQGPGSGPMGGPGMPGNQGMMQGQGQGMPGQGMHQGRNAQAMPTDPASRGYMQSMRTMNREMRKPMTGNADQDFARMMAAHHQGAVDMARVELQHGTDPDLKAMAQKIVDDQTQEIQKLQDWMKQHPAKAAAK
ncbi:CopM family metallochaperone [Azospirillum sp.]|uniref:CopM family metallochaperone n=1 Tax=Azospirillum sp. TaxID=34012 RepID=UPI003D7464E9